MVRHARRLAAWNRCLEAVLPPALQGRLQLAEVARGVAVLHVDSPAWHARVRFQAADLLPRLRTVPGLEALQRIEVRVCVERGTRAPRRISRAVMPAASAKWLGHCARTETDPDLRSVLERLSRR